MAGVKMWTGQKNWTHSDFDIEKAISENLKQSQFTRF